MPSIAQETLFSQKSDNPLTAVRLQIKALGYDIIPLHANKLPFKGWPAQPNSAADIARWGGVATGVRLHNKACLFAIDLDVRIKAVRDEIVTAYKARWGAFVGGCLPRHSGAVTVMLIGRCNTAKGAQKSGRWHSDVTDKKGNLVEVFTSNCKRFIAVQGQHSPGRRYDYHGSRAILNTPVTALPWFPDADIGALTVIADEVMAKHGLQQSVARGAGGGATDRVYDLTPEMEFMLSEGFVVTLQELEELISAVGELRGYATLWDEMSTTPNRVLVNTSATGLALWDTKTGISHRWKHREAASALDEFSELIAQLRAVQALPTVLQ